MTTSRYKGDRSHPGLAELQKNIEHDRGAVVGHRMYSGLNTHDAVKVFMQYHVFAVWDFMCLLKTLQRRLTNVEVPWTPEGPTSSRRLINDIVLIEESDELGDGFTSHFELYLAGMTLAGADTGPITTFIDQLRKGTPVADALTRAGVSRPSADFVASTFSIIDEAPVPCQAAAVAFGREDLIPEMFSQVISIEDGDGKLRIFKDYLARHIDVDGELHSPMAMQMLIDLCGNDDNKWAECVKTVHVALEARTALWDAIAQAVDATRPSGA